jgi:predicted membrane protein
MEPSLSPAAVRPARWGRLLVGLLFVAAGLLFTLSNFGLIRLRDARQYWPLILVAVGLLRLTSRRIFSGLVFLGIGVLLQMRALGVVWFRIEWLFPLVFVLVGLRILTDGFHRRWPPRTGPAGGPINEWAVFGGGDRRISSEFAGGQANAVFGGFNLDLRNSTMVGDAASIDVFCFCGGGEIRVPEAWNVTMKVVAIFGGTDDKTRHDFTAAPGSPGKTLVLTGFILFGGLGVKN